MKNDDPLDWVTRFDDPVVSRAERTLRSRGLTIGLGTLVGGGAIAAIAFLVAALSRPAEEEGGLGAERTPTATPSAPVVETSTSEPSLIPDACDQLFSEGMATTLQGVGLTLGSDWGGELGSGTADVELQKMLDDAALDCHWTGQTATSPLLLTQVTQISSHETGLATARLQQLGFTELNELGGVRYVLEQPTGSGPTGETHFFRDGLWFATHWRGHGQHGYTADMVNSVFT